MGEWGSANYGDPFFSASSWEKIKVCAILKFLLGLCIDTKKILPAQ